MLNEQRRLAFFSAVNIDGANTVKIGRDDKFRLDPRVPTALQCGEWLYANNVLDRGHITRRNDAVWGDLAAVSVCHVLVAGPVGQWDSWPVGQLLLACMRAVLLCTVHEWHSCSVVGGLLAHWTKRLQASAVCA